jgi:hypothetical protein
VIYESVRSLGYLRISPRADAVAFAEFVSVDGDAGLVVALDRNGKELIRSPVFVSVEGVAWPPSGEEVWCAVTQNEGWADAIHALPFKSKSGSFFGCPACSGYMMCRATVVCSSRENRGAADYNFGERETQRNVTFLGSITLN